MNNADDLSLAILRAVGENSDDVVAVSYSHRVGEPGVLIVERAVIKADCSGVATIVQRWTSDVPMLVADGHPL